MYEWYYDKMQPYFGEDNLELHYLDTDSFIFSFKPIKSLIEDLKHFKDDFDFSDLDPSHELFSNEKKSYWYNEIGNSTRIRYRRSSIFKE